MPDHIPDATKMVADSEDIRKIVKYMHNRLYNHSPEVGEVDRLDSFACRLEAVEKDPKLRQSFNVVAHALTQYANCSMPVQSEDLRAIVKAFSDIVPTLSKE